MKAPLLAQIAEVSFAFPVISGAYLYRALGTQGRRFFYYCCLIAMGIIVEAIIPRLGLSNHLFLKFFVVIQTIAITGIFYSFVKNTRLRRLALMVLLFFLVAAAGQYILSGMPRSINEIDIFLSGVIQILLGGLLVNVAINVQEVSYQRNPLFWFGVALLIYNAGTIMILTFMNVIVSMGLEYFRMAWYFNWTLAIFSNILTSYTFVFLRDE